jgi:hypothetical protein
MSCSWQQGFFIVAPWGVVLALSGDPPIAGGMQYLQMGPQHQQ